MALAAARTSCFALTLAATLLAAGSAWAQEAPQQPAAPAPAPAAAAPAAGGSDPNPLSGLPGGGGSGPVAIDADALEWHREDKVYVARGNAVATRGDTTVKGSLLTAHYREDPQGGTQVWRFEADGSPVTIATPTQNVIGQKAVYDIDRAVMVMTGNNLKLTTPTDTVTARDALEYWPDRQIAVARGNAVAVRAGSRIASDVLTALFDKQAGKAVKGGGTAEKQSLKRIEAKGGVTITTATDVVTGDNGVYDVASGKAVLQGHVKITRGDNQLNGNRAEVDLNTGVSKLLADSPAGVSASAPSGGRVRALLVPGSNAGTGLPGEKTGSNDPTGGVLGTAPMAPKPAP